MPAHLTLEALEGRVVPAAMSPDVEQFVTGLYRQMLLRAPDPTGLAGFSQRLVAGDSVRHVVDDIWSSAEFHTVEVTNFYRQYLRRAPDEAGLQSWVRGMLDGLQEEDVVEGFLTSQEFTSLHSDNGSFVTALYAAILHRDPDALGFQAWTGGLVRGMSRNDAVAGFLSSQEFHTDRVDLFYSAILERPPDLRGRTSWLAYWQGNVTIRDVASQFLSSPENVATLTAPTGNEVWGANGPIGQWTVAGQTPDGQSYTGTLSVRKNRETFHAQWTSPELGDWFGLGILHQGLFVLARWQSPHHPGVVHYGHEIAWLHADWSSGDLGGLLGSGLAFRGPGAPVTGIWPITYWNGYGNAAPVLDLHIEPSDSVLDLTWRWASSGQLAYAGVGLTVPGGVVSAWAPAPLSLPLDVLVFRIDASSASANADTARTGQSTIGMETITKAN